MASKISFGSLGLPGSVGTLVVLIIIFGTLTSCKHPGATGERPFKSLYDAVRAGVVDQMLVTDLQHGKPVDAFVILAADPPVLPIIPDTRPEYRMGIMLDKLKKQFASRKAMLRSGNDRIEILRDYDALPLTFVRVTRESDLLQIANDRLVSAVTVKHTNDLHLAETLPLIQATRTTLWNQRGAGVGIAIIDSGVLFSNSAFGSCLTVGAPGCRVALSTDVSPDDGMQDDVTLHGSTMAVIALGVAPAANILMFDASRSPGKIEDDDALAAINTIINRKVEFNIRAVSMSFGHKEYWTSECSASGFVRNPYLFPFQLLRQLDVMPVVSAGNDAANNNAFQNGISWPACTSGAIRVGAVYDSAAVTPSFPAPQSCSDSVAAADTVACFSQTGPLLSIFAPGAAITVPPLRIGAGSSTGSGTSETAPQVAAAYAVLSAFKPLNLATLQPILLNSGPNVTDTRAGITRHRLDVAGALMTLAGPIPDNFAAAASLTGGAPFVSSTTYAATTEPGEPIHAGQQGGASIWYRWVAPYSGTTKIMTFGSDFDTLLGVYTGNAVNAITEVASNDNDSPVTKQSSVTFQAQANVEYHIAVAGKRVLGQVQQGNVQLTINGPPSNDNLTSASVLSSGIPMAGMNYAASKEPGEPDHCQNQGGASVWYKWTTGIATVATVSTLSTTFSMRCVYVYSGPSLAPTMASLRYVAGGTWASWDDIWNATFTPDPAKTYWIAVDGLSNEETVRSPAALGSFTITVSQ